ncbi:hypothetical protein L3X38_004588 [Prunus dulcis]|uniref:RNase H type-1 domain-containing protein n=1 Tax=Prunus dulcis TaxID=3755 RepID=A0AAD4ZP36_PRUDU|nr:hypothetical protein L3X38_004588 [Prunus dulcis]
MNRADPASKRLAPRQPRLLPCRRKTHFRGRADPASKRLAPRQPRLLLCRRKTHFRGARHLPKLSAAKPNLQDTCRHHNGLHKVPHWNFVQSSHFHLPINREQYPAQLAPSPLRPRRLFFTPHSAMPTEDSRDTQHQTPREGTSRRKSPGDASLQAEVERLRDTEPREGSRPGCPTKPDPERWESSAEPASTFQPQLPGPIEAPQGKRPPSSGATPVTTPLRSPTEGPAPQASPDLPRLPGSHLGPSAPVYPTPGPLALETLPHADPAMRLLFEKVRRLESEQHRSHQPLWAKPRPGPFTERILHYHQEKDIQPLRIAFYTGTEDPLTHIHSFQSALGCKGLTDEGMHLRPLTRFISKATDRCAPFFKALKGTKRNITWTAECETAFSELKEYMGRAPLLSTPEHGDILVVYLSVSASAVSSVLIRLKDNAEHPIHYVSKALQDAEVRYPDIEKLAFSLVVSARRLRPYFQAHTIHVLTNQPFRQVLQKPETSGRLVKWAIELGEFDIHYKPRPAMRVQAVADFLSEFTEPQASAATQHITEPNPLLSQDQTPTKNTLDLTQPLWTLFVDGSSNAQGCGAGLVLVSPDKVALEYALRFNFQASNNEAEYEALLAGLRLAKEMDARQIQIFSDSQLVVHQVNQDFTAKDASMTAYLQHARHLLATFHAHTIKQVLRSENSHADALARLASALEQGMGRHIHIEFLAQPSTQAPLICTIDHSPTWMDPILQFLQNQTLPANPAEARRVRHRSARYLIINGSLYKRGFSLPYLRCLTPEEGHYVLREIHEGICGNHLGARSLAHKAIRQGYFWPSLHTDAQAFTQKCDKCQRFANIPQLPAEPLTAMVSPWLFAQWGLDLIGPMPEGKGQVKYAVVAVDYFTKWAEAEALATITAARIESFVWQNIPILSPMARSKL